AGAHLGDDRPERIVDQLRIGQRIVVRGRSAEQLVVDPDVRDRACDVGRHRHLGLAEKRREPVDGELLGARFRDDIGVRAHRLLESLTGDENADDHEYGYGTFHWSKWSGLKTWGPARGRMPGVVTRRGWLREVRERARREAKRRRGA